ncbi:MAG: RecQ family ATP-dependent DNA helicase [Spirochaetaceae bacterium]|jgi:ATP-dependent DNA helicase RecQ|nr:RecQ family ATP-dependent DNA helicase [Spirochaetaceae bacterium]
MEDFYNQQAKELLGIPYIYPYQRLVIDNLLSAGGYWGEQTAGEINPFNLVIFPTGMGKSLCYMLPGILLPGITLVIYPLLSLMEDQYRRLSERNIPAAIYRGGQSKKDREEIQRQLSHRGIRFLLTNPEMCQSSELGSWISQGLFQQLIVDEVHTVLQWGETFRPSLIDLNKIIKLEYFKGIHFFTATLSTKDEKKLKNILIPQYSWNIIRSSGDRSNLQYHLVKSHHIMLSIEEICRNRSATVLIFCNSRKSTVQTAAELRLRLGNIEIRSYHAGMSTQEKILCARWFFHSTRGILCATKAYGMGIDKSDIGYVIHRDPPDSVESYLQEAGRAGRDGRKAYSIVLIKPAMDYEGFIKEFAQWKFCRRSYLLTAMGEHAENCGGCDYCRPIQWTPSVNAMVKRLADRLIFNSGRLNQRDLFDMFLGWYTPSVVSKRLYLYRDFASFKHWGLEDLLPIIDYWKSKDLYKKNRPCLGSKSFKVIKMKLRELNDFSVSS